MASSAHPLSVKTPFRVAIIAGEASGDILGAGLVRELKRLHPAITFEGIGGERMIAEGVDSWYPMERLSIMGLIEVLRHLPDLFQLKRELLERWQAQPPDLFIGVDAPDFNLRIEAALHEQGIRTLHYVSPSVWAWRQGRIHGIKRSVDHMLTLLPFEAKFYEEHQVPVTFVGHPMADEVPVVPQRAKARADLATAYPALATGGPVIAVLPGSRQGEVERLLPVFLESIRLIAQQLPEAMFLIPAANAARERQIRALLPESGNILLFKGQSRACMAASDVALLASGTATLECMLLKTPMVVAYRLANFTYWLMRLLMKAPHVALPNLLADERLVPELIQSDAEPERIAKSVISQLSAERQQALIARFSKLHKELCVDADQVAAGVALDLLQRPALRV